MKPEFYGSHVPTFLTKGKRHVVLLTLAEKCERPNSDSPTSHARVEDLSNGRRVNREDFRPIGPCKLDGVSLDDDPAILTLFALSVVGAQFDLAENSGPNNWSQQDARGST